LCREEIRKAKAQLELRLAGDNKKCFYKYINNKKRAKESLHPVLDARGSIANKDEEKPVRYLMSSLHQSLRVRLPRVVSPQCWKIEKESRTNLP